MKLHQMTIYFFLLKKLYFYRRGKNPMFANSKMVMYIAIATTKL